MSSAFGWNLIEMPAWPAPQTIEWQLVDNEGMTISPFSGQQQTFDWASGRLEASITMPAMERSDARKWWAFLMACRGRLNVFMFGDPLAAVPAGAAIGSPGLDPAVTQSGFTLATTNWFANISGLLLAGDWIQVGNYRLHCLTADASSDADGNALLSIWPNVRESPVPWCPVTYNNPRGLFRLKSSMRKWSQNVELTYGFQFEIQEAL
jgi:hypothetical protein